MQQISFLPGEMTTRERSLIQRALKALDRHLHEPGVAFTSTHAAREWLILNMAGLEREEFRVLYLNNQNQLIAGETLFTGTINRTEVHPREVIKRALYHNAAAVVLAHNHPSGEVTPSKADRLITERLVQALALVDIRQLTEISVLTESIGGKTARDWAMKQDFRCGCWLMDKPETAMKAITRNLDREIWRDLMQRSGMLSLMDAQARDTWYRSLEYDNFPEISEANILSTFEQLHQNKDEVFERGVINVFRGLSWNYENNSPCKFGSKIIVNNLVRWDRWGFHLITGQQADRLADLERMLYLFSGKPIPDNRENITIHLDDHIQSVQGKEDYEDEMFSIRYFKKGSAHITFRKPELVDRLNDIIARHYSEALASTVNKSRKA